MQNPTSLIYHVQSLLLVIEVHRQLNEHFNITPPWKKVILIDQRQITILQPKLRTFRGWKRDTAHLDKSRLAKRFNTINM